MHTFIWRDVRLYGWKPTGDCLESNFDTPLDWMINRIQARSEEHKGDLLVQIMCHGMPGYLQCCRGRAQHPDFGPGITIYDLQKFGEIRGMVKRLELHACLVARMGKCYECGDHEAYDGNLFCYQLAQTIQAEVKASIHVQYYDDGTYSDGSPHGGGTSFGQWNGRVFTWNAEGKIIQTEDFPYVEYKKVKPPPKDTSGRFKEPSGTSGTRW
ncbi:MAG: hypothetical protein R2747_08865 [Pyrinomonadaceae bacterium]